MRPSSRDLAWMDRASCSKVADWHAGSREQQRETCRWCPVQLQCRSYALAQPPGPHMDKAGVVYAGTTDAELREARKPVVLEFNLHRDLLLSSNQRMHWAAVASRVKQLRAKGYRAWLDAGQPRMGRAQIVCRIDYPDARERDAANWQPTAKALVDGVVGGINGRGGNLLPDDSDRYVSGPFMVPGGVIGRGKWRFTLTIEES